jgi:hypothetical protein
VKTVAVTVEYIIGVESEDDDDIIYEVENKLCRVESFDTDIGAIFLIEENRTITPQ